MPHHLPGPIEIDQVSQLVQWLEVAQGPDRLRPVPLWFRGHRGKVDLVTPSLLRRNVEQVLTGRSSWSDKEKQWNGPVGPGEIALNKEFVRRAASLLPNPEDLVEVYFLAQHHGLPTRLLDWTTNPLAALFFSASDNLEADGEVIVIVPGGEKEGGATPGSREAESLNHALPKRHPLLAETIRSLFGEADPPAEARILFILPELRNARIAQQGSCFSLHLGNQQGVSEDALVRLPVPAQAKLLLRESLRTMGVSWADLFPDLDHICLELRASWGFDLTDLDDLRRRR